MTRSDRFREAVTELAKFRAEREAAAPDLFTPIANVLANAGPIWRDEALGALEELARRRDWLTVEHLRPLCSPTLDWRALGGILLEGARRGWITPEGYVNGGASRHGRPIRRWRCQLGDPHAA